MPVEDQVKCFHADRPVALQFICVGQGSHKPVPIPLVFRDIMPDSGSQRRIEPFRLSVCLPVIRRGEDVAHSQEGTDRLEAFCDELGSVFGL